LRLEAPVKRVAGWATHTGLMFEQFIIPDVTSKCPITADDVLEWMLTIPGVYDAIKKTLDY
jgi:2-oxoisovalerate dehydrogenase E1 component beta subunit